MKMRKRKLRGMPLPGWAAAVRSWLEHRWHNLKRWQRITCASLASVMLIAAIIPTAVHFIESRRYELSDQMQQLVGTTDKDLAAKISYDKPSNSWLFNKGDIPIASGSADQADNDAPTPNMLQAKVGGSGKDDQSLYSVRMPADASQGTRYYDSNTRLSFSLIPQFKMSQGKEVNGQLIYPAQRGATVVYTAKSNGMKEDIVLTKPIGDEVSYGYDLELPSDLTAKILYNGGLGVYSAEPTLYGDFAFGDSQDLEKIKSARETAAKDHLLFEIPAPIIKQTGDGEMKASAKFVLDGTTLRVDASHMNDLRYPVTIDPSVVVTSSTDFLTGAADTNIDFPSGQISRGKVTGGTIDAWTTTGGGSFTKRSFGMSVIYNGYMYYVGGDAADVPYAPIDSGTGALGTWSTTTSLPDVRRYAGVTAYNGYMYVYGGYVSGTTASADVLVAQINGDGTLGSWTTAANGMATAACRFGITTYNGYVYAVAGNAGTVASNCGNGSTNQIATTQYAKMGAGGTVGTWSTSANEISTAVQSPAVAAYNGYLYSVGGTITGSGGISTVQYAKISATTGDIGAWTTSSQTMSTTNYRQGIAAYNGYLYLLGGTNNSTYTLYSQINENGDIGTIYRTTDLLVGRYAGGFAVYNGYMYYMAGTVTGTGALNDAAYAKINPAGSTSSFSTTNSFTTNRRGLEYVSDGAYTYVLGGDNGSTPVSTVYKSLVGSSGDTGSFSATTSLPANLTFSGAAIYQGYLYVVGGCTSAWSSCTTTGNNVSTVYKAAINSSNGTLDSWSTETSLSTARYGHKLVAYNGYLYAIGGLNGSTFQSSIEYHAIGASGAISGSWSSSAQTISSARAYFGASIYGGRLYIAGGCTSGPTSCSSSLNDVQYAPISSSGDLSGAFTTNSTSFSTARSGHQLLVSYGNAYIVGGYDGSSYLSDIQVAPLNSDGSIGTWTTSTSFATARGWLGAIIARGYIQVAGGYSGSYLNSVEYAYLNNGGSYKVDSWSSTGSTVTGWANSGGAVHKGFLYQAGGNVSGTPTANVKYTPLNSTGTTDSWASASTMNTARDNPAVYTVGNYLYATGGTNASSTLQSSTEYAYINSDGSLGAWTVATASLASARAGGAYAQYGSYIYYLGGKDGSSDLTSVSYAEAPSGDVVSWSSGTALPIALYRASAVAYSGNMYIIGGGASDGSSYSDKVYTASINTSDGSLGSWSLTTTMPATGYVSAVGYNGIMYITGSYRGSYGTATYIAPINSNGTLGNWEKSPSQSSVDNVASKSFGYQGYLYHLAAGGLVSYGAADTTARIGNYSKVIGLGGGYSLVNISYNGNLPGGKYNINYRTADTDGAFGSRYSSTALSGNSAACSVQDVAYVLVLVRLDDSGSAVFPDSYSSAADVTDLTIGYGVARAEPSKRLAHGKYFSDESLQALDTCGS